MLAQAVLEKGILDGALSGVSQVFSEGFEFVEANPYWFLGAAVLLAVLLLRRRR